VTRVFIGEGPCDDFVWVDGIALQRWQGTLVAEGGVISRGSIYVYRVDTIALGASPSSTAPVAGTSATPSE